MSAMLHEKIKEFIVINYMGGEGAGLDIHTPLLELNILHSAAMFDLVDFLADTAGVMVPVREIAPENFASIAAMVQMVSKLNEGRATGRDSDRN